MDYSKVITIDDYDLTPIENLDDYEERIRLLKSYIGQRTFINAKSIPRAQRRIDTNRRVKRPQDKCIEHWKALDAGWEKKIQMVLAGIPLDEVKGKVDTGGSSMPASTKHSARHAKYVAQMNKKRGKRKAKRERERLAAQENNNGKDGQECQDSV